MSLPNHEFLKSLVEELVLAEMPIRNYATVGDFSRRSSLSSPVDRALVTHPQAIEKIKRMWSKTPYNFDIFIVNDPRVNKSEFREVGEVSEQYVRERLRLTPEEVPINPGAVTIIFTNNVAAEKTHLTGWTMAHRFGHAVSRMNKSIDWKSFTEHLQKIMKIMLKDVYGIDINMSGYFGQPSDMSSKILKYVAQSLGTMKSARDSNLRNWSEFAYELLAQYLITGSIKLNPLPNAIQTGVGGWGRKEKRGVVNPSTQKMYNDHDLEYYASELETLLDNVLGESVGKIYVM